LTASLTQPLFVAGLFPGFKIAQKGADLAKEDLRKTLIETQFNAANAYYGVLKAEKFYQLSEQAREMAQNHRDEVKTMLAAGATTRADLLRAEVQLANSTVTLTKMKNTLDIAKNAFNNALGNGLEQEVKLEEPASSPINPPLLDYNQLVKSAFDHRPDWKQYLNNKQMGEENLRVAQTAYLPTVMLSGQTGNHITEYPDYRSDVNSWTVATAASWTLFDGLGVQNRIKEAAANFEAQQAGEEQVKNGIILEVRDAFLNLMSAQETIGSASDAVTSAEENYIVSRSLYNSGSGTNLEVINAQISLTQVRMNYFQAFYDLEIAKAKLNKVVGKEVL